MCVVMGMKKRNISRAAFENHMKVTTSRGPDGMRVMQAGDGFLGFQRLSIMGLTEAGMQPFERNGNIVVCNGELYGFRNQKAKLMEAGYTFQSDSDCEIILPLYELYGRKIFSMLDAEYAMILYDAKEGELIAARDPIGIRPLFYGYDESGDICFASEAKNLVGLTEKIMPFPPGHYYKGEFVCYNDLAARKPYVDDDLETVCKNIREKLIAGVEKRLDADAKIGFLLSGGLDSSLYVLRADRCISVHSMEARVPFGDLDFVSYVMSIPPEKKMNDKIAKLKEKACGCNGECDCDAADEDADEE